MRKLCLGASLAALMMASALGVAYAADYTPVTDARLANPEPQNWLMTRGNYAGWSYSPLEQVNVSNVKIWSRCGAFRPESILAMRRLRSSTMA